MWFGLLGSLFGFLALPGRYYLLGMLAFAVLYSLVSIEYALGHSAIKDLLSFVGLRKK